MKVRLYSLMRNAPSLSSLEATLLESLLTSFENHTQTGQAEVAELPRSQASLFPVAGESKEDQRSKRLVQVHTANGRRLSGLLTKPRFILLPHDCPRLNLLGGIQSERAEGLPSMPSPPRG